jgi:polysaccharide biosynthesis/export protein
MCKRLLVTRILIIGIMILNFSCVPFNKVRYFTDVDEISDPVANPRQGKKIKPFDMLYIKVLSTDQQSANIFNLSDNSQSGIPLTLAGYTVDEQGNIIFPFVGNINVNGLTIEQASDKIKLSLSKYISNASILLKFVENKISILGEVRNQGVYDFSQDKINIYEGLALGGGLTQYADRRNVILIRQEGDKILHYKLDLSNSKIASKDYYYLISNDVIVVEPMKAISHSYNSSNIQTILTSITAILSLYLLIRR